MQAQENVQLEDSMSDENVEICENCNNIYRLIWLKKGDDYNDFGFRYCPFFGFIVEELAHLGN